jgi:hypothetical protein
MFVHWKALKEEIDFYERQNKRLCADDLLREQSGKSKINQQKIQENEERIERLLYCLLEN